MHANSSSSLRTENPQDHPEVILKENSEDQTILQANVSVQDLDSSPSGGRGGGSHQYRIIRHERSRLPDNNINLNIRRSHSSGARSSSAKTQHGLNTLVSIPPPLPPPSQGNGMHGIVNAHQFSAGLGLNPCNSSTQDLQRRHNGNILIGSYPISLVDSTRPQRSATSSYDRNQKLQLTSATDLPVLNQESEARNSLQGHNHGIGTNECLGASSFIDGQNIHGSQTIHSSKVQTAIAGSHEVGSSLAATCREAADLVLMYRHFLDLFPEVKSGLDEAQIEKAIEDLKTLIETPQQMNHDNPISEHSQIVLSPSGHNPSIDCYSSIESKNNNAKSKQEEREGRSKDATTLGNEGTKLTSEVESSFAGLVPFLMNDEFEDLIKWPDPDFLSYSDPYGFDP
ncbi:OLC1v1005789C1 [Oldenlandia corymbosa var. corymbosa]|uniref:OLC1v1005789C1 n=1 Tax=Oldenlandia corymbosa var. corymbosa TaxID=529605 RepID=A0AAV1DFD0_OLDCO|nr:OLC1v1005789C1 [Oldenlandia corymbosa var. corymbosa]